MAKPTLAILYAHVAVAMAATHGPMALFMRVSGGRGWHMVMVSSLQHRGRSMAGGTHTEAPGRITGEKLQRHHPIGYDSGIGEVRALPLNLACGPLCIHVTNAALPIWRAAILNGLRNGVGSGQQL